MRRRRNNYWVERDDERTERAPRETTKTSQTGHVVVHPGTPEAKDLDEIKRYYNLRQNSAAIRIALAEVARRIRLERA